jgi:hypothetical protein
MVKSNTFAYPGQACAQLGNIILVSDTVVLLSDYAALKSDMEVLCRSEVEHGSAYIGLDEVFQDNVALELDK